MTEETTITEETATTIEDFIQELGLTLELSEAPENPNVEDSANTMFNWRYAITRKDKGKQITGYYSQGFGHVQLLTGFGNSNVPKSQLKGFEGNLAYDPKHRDVVARTFNGRGYLASQYGLKWRKVPPTLADILDCLASDTSTVRDSSFEDWCGDLGYDADSRRAERTFDICKKQARDLEGLLGRVELERLLNNIERM